MKLPIALRNSSKFSWLTMWYFPTTLLGSIFWLEIGNWQWQQWHRYRATTGRSRNGSRSHHFTPRRYVLGPLFFFDSSSSSFCSCSTHTPHSRHCACACKDVSPRRDKAQGIVSLVLVMVRRRCRRWTWIIDWRWYIRYVLLYATVDHWTVKLTTN